MTAAPQDRLIVRMRLNGGTAEVEVEPRVSLLDALHDRLGLTGTKKGCNQGACGACTVLVDGRRVVSCLHLAVQADGCEVTTIEGIGTPDAMAPLQTAFVSRDGFQCGYCTAGQICSATGMLAEAERGEPSAVTAHLAAPPGALDAPEIRERMSGNLCRCGAYNGIVEAIGDIVGGAR